MNGGTIGAGVDGAIIANDTAFTLTVAQAGLRLARALDVEARRSVESGVLMRVLAAWTPPLSGSHLCHPGTRQMPLQLKAFLDCLKLRMA
jgi:DNA-binding transcriptional LysR family regulator